MSKAIDKPLRYILSRFAVVLFLLVICGCSSPNDEPVILDLVADKITVKKGGEVHLEVFATDYNHDTLSYSWSANGGEIQSKGRDATWIAPDAFDSYEISVSVEDGRGGKVSQSVSISVEWEVFTSGGLSSNRISAILLNKEGDIWVGTGKGIGKYDANNEEWVTYDSTNSGLVTDSVTSLALDVSGNLWIGTYTEGGASSEGELFKVNVGSDMDNTSNWISGFPQGEEAKFQRVTSLAVTNGDVWVGTDGGGISKYDGTNTALSGDSVGEIIADSSTIPPTIWVGSSGGISKFDGTWTEYLHASSSTSPTGGSNIIDPDMDPASVDALALDKAGNIWAVLQQWKKTNGGFAVEKNGGLYKYDGNSWVSYSIPDGGSNVIKVYVIKADSKDNLWVGTNRGLKVFDGLNWATYNTSNSSLPNDNVISIFIDDTDQIWVGTANGLAKKHN